MGIKGLLPKFRRKKYVFRVKYACFVHFTYKSPKEFLFHCVRKCFGEVRETCLGDASEGLGNMFGRFVRVC